MAAGKRVFSQIRLVYRRSSNILKCVVLAAIVFSTAALTAIGVAQGRANAQAEALRAKAAALELDNKALTQQISTLGTAESIRRIATEMLDLVDPDSVFFCPVEPTNPS